MNVRSKEVLYIQECALLDKFHCSIFKYVLTVLKYLKKSLIAYRVRHVPATFNGRVRMM